MYVCMYVLTINGSLPINSGMRPKRIRSVGSAWSKCEPVRVCMHVCMYVCMYMYYVCMYVP